MNTPNDDLKTLLKDLIDQHQGTGLESLIAIVQDHLAENSLFCCVCGGKADLLCDGTLPRWTMTSTMAAKGSKYAQAELHKGLKERMLSEVPTASCDRPLCAKCAYTPDGPIFFCGEGGGVETRDYCPECAKWKYQRKSFTRNP